MDLDVHDLTISRNTFKNCYVGIYNTGGNEWLIDENSFQAINLAGIFFRAPYGKTANKSSIVANTFVSDTMGVAIKFECSLVGGIMVNGGAVRANEIAENTLSWSKPTEGILMYDAGTATNFGVSMNRIRNNVIKHGSVTLIGGGFNEINSNVITKALGLAGVHVEVFLLKILMNFDEFCWIFVEFFFSPLSNLQNSRGNRIYTNEITFASAVGVLLDFDSSQNAVAFNDLDGDICGFSDLGNSNVGLSNTGTNQC